MLRHPFDLNLEELQAQDLEFEEVLTDTVAQSVGGQLSIFTTLAIGEEGGRWPNPGSKPFPCYCQRPVEPPEVTTQALGEEGGAPLHPDVTTLAMGEEGGYIDDPRYLGPPEATTLALGEEG